MEQQRAIFVGGLQRSGTTLLGQLISQHPDVAGLTDTPESHNEGQFFQDVYMDDHRMGLKNGSTVGRSIRWGYHSEAHLVEDDVTYRRDAASRLLASWSPYFDKPNAPQFVEKSPSNVMKTRFLQEAFPSARFVVITRHPIMQGLAVRKWGTRRVQIGLNFDAVLDHWLHVMETYRADRERLASVFECSYEQLVRDPQLVMRQLHEFLGVRHVPIDVSRIRDSDAAYRSYWARYSGRAAEGAFHPLYPTKSRRSRILQLAEGAVAPIVGPRTARRIERKFSDRVAAFGYDISDLESFPSR